MQAIRHWMAATLGALAALSLSATFVTVAQAKDAWPVKTITLVQPYAPGGTSDMLARIVALELEKHGYAWLKDRIAPDRAPRTRQAFPGK